MSLQKTVGRQYTQGWVGEISADGPSRAKPARIKARVTGAVTTPNRIGRAFTYSEEMAGTGTTQVAVEFRVAVGGVSPFVGILAIPKHYTLFGNTTDGPLGSSVDLPAEVEGEFMDMGIMNLSVSNGSDVAGVLAYNSKLYYAAGVGAAAAGFVEVKANDLGRLYAFSGTAPDVSSVIFKEVPNAKLTVAVTTNVAPATPNPDGGPVVDAGAVIVRAQLTN